MGPTAQQILKSGIYNSAFPGGKNTKHNIKTGIEKWQRARDQIPYTKGQRPRTRETTSEHNGKGPRTRDQIPETKNQIPETKGQIRE